MKFQANRSELLPIVRRLCLTIGKRYSSTEKSCVLMEADETQNTVVFTAVGTDCALQVRHACPVEQSGKAMLFGGVYLEILDHFSDEATTVMTDDKRLSIRNAKSAYEFLLMDANKYPALNIAAPDWLLDCTDLPEIVSKVLFSAARGECSSHLHCVHLCLHDGCWRAETCDGHRLTIARRESKQQEPLDALLTDSVMKTLLAVMRGVPACKVGVNGQKVVFLAPGMVFCAQMNERRYMDLQKVVKGIEPISMLDVNGSLFYEELSRLGAVHGGSARIVMQTAKNMIVLRLMGTDDLHAQTSFAAEVKSELPVEGFCYQYSYLMDAARLIRGQTVTLQFDRIGYLMIQTECEQHILLPMRMPEPVAGPKKKTKKKAA